jgi:hypothetical protein
MKFWLKKPEKSPVHLDWIVFDHEQRRKNKSMKKIRKLGPPELKKSNLKGSEHISKPILDLMSSSVRQFLP